MEPIKFVFLIGAAIVLGSALMVVTRKNLVHAALYLIVTLAGVAMIFVLLQAYYWAVIQVVVYIGAIAIMIIMAVMVTRDVTGKQGNAFNKIESAGLVVGIFASTALLLALSSWPKFEAAPQQMTVVSEDTIRTLGQQLFAVDGYLLPTIVASVLLLAALIGAIKIALPIDQEKEEK